MIMDLLAHEKGEHTSDPTTLLGLYSIQIHQADVAQPFRYLSLSVCKSCLRRKREGPNIPGECAKRQDGWGRVEQLPLQWSVYQIFIRRPNTRRTIRCPDRAALYTGTIFGPSRPRRRGMKAIGCTAFHSWVSPFPSHTYTLQTKATHRDSTSLSDKLVHSFQLILLAVIHSRT